MTSEHTTEDLRDLLDDLYRTDRWSRRLTEWVASRVADGPQAKGEMVLRPRDVGVLLRRTGGGHDWLSARRG